jgi:hypothetical protein
MEDPMRCKTGAQIARPQFTSCKEVRLTGHKQGADGLLAEQLKKFRVRIDATVITHDGDARP